MPSIAVNDINLYYELHGDGQPLVLILGLGTDVSEWDWLVRWLAERYRVLVFDNRGAGRTDKPDIPYSIAMMANDTAGLMQAVGMEQAIILGISMGGRIALELALQHPQMVKKLILVSTSARTIPRRWRGTLLDLLHRIPLKPSSYPQPHDAFVRQREASSSYDGRDRLQEIVIPTLIMHGSKDRVIPYPLAEEMHDRIKGSRLVTFDGGHLFFLVRGRQRFLDAIEDFAS